MFFKKVRSDPKIRWMGYKVGISEHGLSADGDGAAPSSGRQKCVLLYK